MAKSKRLIVLSFIVFFMNDICKYIKAFIKAGYVRIDRISLFNGHVNDQSVLHFSIVFFLVVVVLFFFANFFKRDDF